MKHKKKNTRSIYVNQVKITFTGKPITAWGGIAALVGKFLEGISFQEWVEKNIPIKETSHNAKGIYEKILGQFLTVLSGGSRFQHLSWWGHGKEVMLKGSLVTASYQRHDPLLGQNRQSGKQRTNGRMLQRVCP